MTTEKSAFQIQIENMDRKLDEHGDDLREIRKTMELIAVQNVQIANLQTAQSQDHAAVELMRGQLNLMMNWQAGCPRSSVNKLWMMFWGVVIVFLGAFVAHVMKG